MVFPRECEEILVRSVQIKAEAVRMCGHTLMEPAIPAVDLCRVFGNELGEDIRARIRCDHVYLDVVRLHVQDQLLGTLNVFKCLIREPDHEKRVRAYAGPAK